LGDGTYRTAFHTGGYTASPSASSPLLAELGFAILVLHQCELGETHPLADGHDVVRWEVGGYG
jgi:hypothetical protein